MVVGYTMYLYVGLQLQMCTLCSVHTVHHKRRHQLMISGAAQDIIRTILVAEWKPETFPNNNENPSTSGVA